MGGVSRASQLYVTALLEPERVRQARTAVSRFYSSQRARYGEGLAGLGFDLFTGEGGFYHWGRLPGGLTADQFNQRLFQHDAGILPGPLCDMARRKGADCPLDRFVRFSFGPLAPDSFESDVAILAQCV
jgi:DNA-binding transcriptional MocR family regulator